MGDPFLFEKTIKEFVGLNLLLLAVGLQFIGVFGARSLNIFLRVHKSQYCRSL